MRTSLSCIVRAALLLASAVLTSCAAPAPARAPTAAPAAQAPAAPVVITTPTPRGQSTLETGSGADWDRIRAAGRIVVGVSPQYRPFAYYNADSKLDGFDVAVVQELGRRLGLEAVPTDVAPADLAEALGRRQIDLALPGPGSAIKGEEVADFTAPFHVCHDVILADERTGAGEVRIPSDLAGRVIGTLSGSRHEVWLRKTLPEQGQLAAASLYTYTLVSQLVGALRAGQIDLAIVDDVQAAPLLKRGGVRLVGQDLNKQNRYLAVPKGSEQLKSELERALTEMAGDGALRRFSDRYLGLTPADLALLQSWPPEKEAAPTPSPTPTAGPPPGSFAAEPIHIAPGECTRFTWNVENVREIYFYARGERWERSPATGQESRQVCPAATTAYELRIVGADGATKVRSITILVDENTPAPISASLSTTPLSAIRLGECLMLSWEVRGDPNLVQIERDQIVLWANAPQTGSVQDCPAAAGPVVYGLLASAPGDTVHTQRVIMVNP